MPRVSVVIPTFNRRGMVFEAVESVLCQTWRDWELVVVDDGSTDGTAEALEAEFGDPRVRVFRQENAGASAARNRGARGTRGPLLAFLDSDDTWLPEKLERQLEALREHPESPACYTEEIWYRRGRRVNPRTIHAKHGGWVFDRCLPLCIISPSSILLSRGVFEGLGGFDESLPACEDYEFWLRLAARHPIHLVAEPLIVKRNGHAGQLSQVHWGLDRFRIRALWNVVRDPGVADEQRQSALECLVAKAAVVARGAEKRGEPARAEVFWHSRKEAIAWLERLSGKPSESQT